MTEKTAKPEVLTPKQRAKLRADILESEYVEGEPFDYDRALLRLQELKKKEPHESFSAEELTEFQGLVVALSQPPEKTAEIAELQRKAGVFNRSLEPDLTPEQQKTLNTFYKRTKTAKRVWDNYRTFLKSLP